MASSNPNRKSLSLNQPSKNKTKQNKTKPSKLIPSLTFPFIEHYLPAANKPSQYQWTIPTTVTRPHRSITPEASALWNPELRKTLSNPLSANRFHRRIPNLFAHTTSERSGKSMKLFASLPLGHAQLYRFSRAQCHKTPKTGIWASLAKSRPTFRRLFCSFALLLFCSFALLLFCFSRTRRCNLRAALNIGRFALG